MEELDGNFSSRFAAIIEKKYENRTFGELADAARDVEGLFAHPGWSVVQGLLDDFRRFEMERPIFAKEPVAYGLAAAQKDAFVRGLDTSRDAARTIIDVAVELQANLEASRQEA